MRAYDVPRALAPETQSVLKSLMYRGRETPSIGSVAVAPTGQLLVTAPPGFHDGVEQVVTRLKTGKIEQPPVVKTTFTTIFAKPGEPSVKGASPRLEKVLNEIASKEKLSLVVFDVSELSSVSGDRAELRGSKMDINQVATFQDDTVNAEVSIQHIRGSGKLEARFQLKAGETLRLGRAGQRAEDEQPFAGADDVTVFYFVDAEVESR